MTRRDGGWVCLALLALLAPRTLEPAAAGSSRGIPPMQVGVTHVGDWEPWSKHPESVERAQALMRGGGVTWQNQGVVGSGGLWLPAKTKAPVDWSHLDYRVSMMRNASAVGGRMVLRLFDAPNWMCNTTADSAHVGWPLLPEHYGDFAEFCGQVAARYPDVTHFEVWNEMDGFVSNWTWNKLDGMRVDGPGYTDLFVQVSKAVKAVNPHAKVGGPYAPVSAGQLPPGKTSPAAAAAVPTTTTTSECSGAWGAINPAMLEFIAYFVEHAEGHYDFLTLDGHLAYEAFQFPGNKSVYKRPANGDPLGATKIFPDVTRWVRDKSGLAADVPIWWSEFYPVPCHDTAMYAPAEQVWPLEQQLAVYTKAAQEIADPALGVELMLNWPAMSNENCIVGMYNDTNQANGGMPTPFYAVAREINKKSRLSEKVADPMS